MLSENFVQYSLRKGGTIKPLTIPFEKSKGSGLLNPSVCVVDGVILVNVRHVNYTLYHSETKRFPHCWGPLQYLHPEDDLNLRTENFISVLDEDLNVEQTIGVDMILNETPKWNFVGLEDARLVNWDSKLYLCGVRRDHIDSRGTGRMNISEIQLQDDKYVEVSRYNVESTDPNSYCEKNWMPVSTNPFEFIKWSNPTELVEYSIENNKTNQLKLDESKIIPLPRDLRGGSQLIQLGDYWVAFTHEVNLYKDTKGHKDAKYIHRVVAWDKNWNITAYSDTFSFMGGEIEFVAGAALYNDDIIVSFGFQDNAAYIVKLPKQSLLDMLTNQVDWNE